MDNNKVVIVSALRTAVGAFNKSLSSLSAARLSAILIKKTLETTGIHGEEISEVIMGNVLTANTGQNSARQAAIYGGLPKEIPAWTVNQVCGSGLRAVISAYQSIISGTSDIILAGGHENMSRTPHAMHLRNALKLGDAKMVDLMVYDGLTDVFTQTHMGVTAENIAKRFNISREEQDIFAASSQNKAEIAQKSGKFINEIIPINVPNYRQEDIIFSEDEYVRHGVTAASLAKLKAAFIPEGTVTAGNASGINDGSALLMLMKETEAKKRGLVPIATIKSFAQVGVDYAIMGTGPVPASRKALELAEWTVQDLELIEANEAFAAQAIYVNNEMGWNEQIVNVNGGAIAIGHPIGASGARIIVTLLHEMLKRNAKKGLATLCVGGGMGLAICFERE